MKAITIAVVVGLLCFATADEAFAGASRLQLAGAGGTDAVDLYNRYLPAFEAKTGIAVTYHAVGTHAGLKMLKAGSIDFAAADALPTGAPNSDPWLSVPIAVIGVTPIVNVPGIAAGRLRFTGATLAAIYGGAIVKWNDPRLVADNPALAHVDLSIVPVHRSDGVNGAPCPTKGSCYLATYLFSNYLAAVSKDFARNIGRGIIVPWPVGVAAAENDGVANTVMATAGAIGYVEVRYALAHRVALPAIGNAAGRFITPTLKALTAAARDAASRDAGALHERIVNAPGSDSYPIAGRVWLVARERQDSPERAAALRSLFKWALHTGQRYNASVGFAPIPRAVATRSEQALSHIAFNPQRTRKGSQ